MRPACQLLHSAAAFSIQQQNSTCMHPIRPAFMQKKAPSAAAKAVSSGTARSRIKSPTCVRGTSTSTMVMFSGLLAVLAHRYMSCALSGQCSAAQRRAMQAGLALGLAPLSSCPVKVGLQGVRACGVQIQWPVVCEYGQPACFSLPAICPPSVRHLVAVWLPSAAVCCRLAAVCSAARCAVLVASWSSTCTVCDRICAAARV